MYESDEPDLIRTLASPSHEIRDRATQALFGNIWRQGTVYEATAPAVPFLYVLLVAGPDKSSVAYLLANIAAGPVLPGMPRDHPGNRRTVGIDPGEEGQDASSSNERTSMTKQDDGGGAFPCGVLKDGHNPGHEPWQRGISVRGYFAAAALQGICCNGFQPCTNDNPPQWDFDGYASCAYLLADAMLKARSA